MVLIGGGRTTGFRYRCRRILSFHWPDFDEPELHLGMGKAVV